MSLEVWLSTGEKVTVGGRELHLMPLSLSRLRKYGEILQNRTTPVYLETVTKGDQLDIMVLVGKVIKDLEFLGDMCFEMFSSFKDPDSGELLNQNLTREFFTEYLDPPSLRKIVVGVIKVNELEETIKNLFDLPGAREFMRALIPVFGLGLLNSSLQSTDSVPSRSEGSRSPSSTGTSPPTTTDSPGGGPEKEAVQ